MVLRGLTIDRKSLKEHLEVIGHKEAFDYVRQLVCENTEISEKVIKDIHYLVLADKKEDRGIYRRIPVRIMGAAHEPVQPYLIIPKMEELLAEYKNSKEDIVTKLARFHIEFEAIHPFIDGNGRTGRLVMNFELMKAGYPICIIKNEDRLEYYNSLNEAQANNNYDEIVKFVEENLEKTFEFYFEHISNNWQEEFEMFCKGGNI